MYELTDKQIRAEFKKTEYGKKVNKLLLGFGIPTLILCFISGFLDGFFHGTESELTETTSLLIESFHWLTIIFIILTLYFDGKRDGAIEQFKITMK